ncbi:SDR family NAD(P)-dependent oxidoreductase [Aestuariivirga litoralis]|uniref:SDR family NAD(P)-dependent oxidoreductase n=1 Tax=Aestuariivirga litoralis TaxID=2650924 RepID=UPI0018C4DB28|nr:SDR family oxidoreductase [Aestuariivirga litoralis]MBG1232622.1 SDR family oxidoreductase [Aestuariivirga litoralis]
MDVALVTGASAGLGVIFAKKLAAQKQNLVLVARRKDRLEALAKELKTAHGVEVFVETADLGEPGAAAKLMKAVAGQKLTISTLINNAGLGTLGNFAEQTPESQTNIVNVNCTSLIELSHAVLPEMIARKSGAILNVASTAAFQAGPKMSIYYASKAFVLSFSEALHDEVKKHGIHVSCLCPGPTRTEFFETAGATQIGLAKLAGSPESVVDTGLKALARNKTFVVTGLHNKIMAQGTRFAPRAVTRTIARVLM